MESKNNLIDDNVLNAIEEFWGYKLPQSYRLFLLENNGGKPFKKIFNFKNKDDGSCIDEFFGIIKNFNNNLLLKQKYLSNRVPENTIPIGRDAYGNFILLSIKGTDRGKVYFWDHESEASEGEKPDYSNLTLIADNFDEFINSLHDLEEE